MTCLSKWKHGLKPAVTWWLNFDVDTFPIEISGTHPMFKLPWLAQGGTAALWPGA